MNEIIKIYFADYKNEFLYFNLDAVSYDNQVLSGTFLLNKCPYLKIDSLILNNTESIFILNQAQYIAIAYYLLETKQMNTDNLEECVKKLDFIVSKGCLAKFKKPVIKNESSLKFECHLNSIMIDHKNRMCYRVNVNICDGAYLLESDFIFLDQDLHHDGLK